MDQAQDAFSHRGSSVDLSGLHFGAAQFVVLRSHGPRQRGEPPLDRRAGLLPAVHRHRVCAAGSAVCVRGRSRCNADVDPPAGRIWHGQRHVLPGLDADGLGLGLDSRRTGLLHGGRAFHETEIRLAVFLVRPRPGRRVAADPVRHPDRGLVGRLARRSPVLEHRLAGELAHAALSAGGRSLAGRRLCLPVLGPGGAASRCVHLPGGVLCGHGRSDRGRPFSGWRRLDRGAGRDRVGRQFGADVLCQDQREGRPRLAAVGHGARRFADLDWLAAAHPRDQQRGGGAGLELPDGLAVCLGHAPGRGLQSHVGASVPGRGPALVGRESVRQRSGPVGGGGRSAARFGSDTLDRTSSVADASSDRLPGGQPALAGPPRRTAVGLGRPCGGGRRSCCTY